MDQVNAIEAFAALAQASRMAIFRLLVRVGPEGLQVGEIGRRLDIAPSTLSGHLGVLKRRAIESAPPAARDSLFGESRNRERSDRLPVGGLL